MPEPLSPFELEESLKDVSRMPEPDTQFVDSLRARFVAEGRVIANQNKKIQMKSKTFLQSPSWIVATLMLTTFVVLFMRFTVPNMPESLPGNTQQVGVVDQTSTLRVLTKPVKVVHDGVLVTVEQAALSSEKTVIVYSYQLPSGKSLIPETTGKDRLSSVLVLPDGMQLEMKLERRVSAEDCSECDARYWMEFDPIPADINEAVLELPSVAATPVGQASQNWKIELKFKAADPSEIPPVIPYLPSPTSTVTNTKIPTKPATQTQTLTPIPSMIANTRTSHPPSRPPVHRTSTPTPYKPATSTSFPATFVASPTLSVGSPTSVVSPTPWTVSPTPWTTPSSPTPSVGWSPTPAISSTPWTPPPASTPLPTVTPTP
jgi:hypothetical protein